MKGYVLCPSFEKSSLFDVIKKLKNKNKHFFCKLF